VCSKEGSKTGLGETHPSSRTMCGGSLVPFIVRNLKSKVTEGKNLMSRRNVRSKNM
jgi:hypothetical protein